MSLSQIYDLPAIDNDLYCTLMLSRFFNKEKLSSHKLNLVYDYYFPGKQFNHHRALDDAYVCGDVFSEMIKHHGLEKVSSILYGKTNPYIIRDEKKTSCRCSKSKNRSGSENAKHQYIIRSYKDKQSLETKILERYSHNPIVENSEICITGRLEQFTRNEFSKIVEELGAVSQKNVTKETNILIVGELDKRSLSEGETVSRKVRKAKRLKETG